jgi:hypothetical protein
MALFLFFVYLRIVRQFFGMYATIISRFTLYINQIYYYVKIENRKI